MYFDTSLKTSRRDCFVVGSLRLVHVRRSGGGKVLLDQEARRLGDKQENEKDDSS
jgi:hypothetical protein